MEDTVEDTVVITENIANNKQTNKQKKYTNSTLSTFTKQPVCDAYCVCSVYCCTSSQ